MCEAENNVSGKVNIKEAAFSMDGAVNSTADAESCISRCIGNFYYPKMKTCI
jgi:hypothetical protein